MISFLAIEFAPFIIQIFLLAVMTGNIFAAAVAAIRAVEEDAGERRMRKLVVKGSTSVPLWPDGKGGWTTKNPIPHTHFTD